MTMRRLLATFALVALTGAFWTASEAAAPALTLTGVTPDHGPAGGSTLVTIHGSGLPTLGQCEPPVIEVFFDGLSAFTTEPPTATQVRVSTPAHAGGPVNVTVINNCDHTTATLNAAYTYVSPTILHGSIPKDGGYGLFVFGGGTNNDLVAASGCPKATATFWATNATGQFVTFIPGTAVQAVNDAWNRLFPDGIPYNTALIGRCV
ncbi:MAG: IPT/TIG domain-containing protein [Dehalococcoidia bacterium]|nr:IPT/TIG domain-containing protein [Dehalococcoidia bacterium]